MVRFGDRVSFPVRPMVGVIGVAFFYEQGDSPGNWNAAGDALRRQQANPFPQQYATPP